MDTGGSLLGGGQGLEKMAHHNLVPRLRISSSVPPTPHTPSWLSQGFYL